MNKKTIINKRIFIEAVIIFPFVYVIISLFIFGSACVVLFYLNVIKAKGIYFTCISISVIGYGYGIVNGINTYKAFKNRSITM
jgi:hypothetical protein